MKKISILIPVFNEFKNIEECLKKVNDTKINNFEKEIVVSDNFSNDGTREYLYKLYEQEKKKK